MPMQLIQGVQSTQVNFMSLKITTSEAPSLDDTNWDILKKKLTNMSRLEWTSSPKYI